MKILLEAAALSLKNRIKSLQTSHLILLIIFALFLATFVSFATWIFLRIFTVLKSTPLFGMELTYKTIYILLMLSAGMLFISSLIIAFNVFFKNLLGLVVLPVKPWKILVVKILETNFYSSGMIFTVLIPMFIAVIKVFKINIFYFITFVANLFMFTASVTSLAIAVLFGLVRIFPYERIRNAFMFMGVVAFSIIYVSFRIIQPEKLTNPDALETVKEYLKILEIPKIYILPSHWLSADIINGLNGRLSIYSIIASMILISVVAAICGRQLQKFFTNILIALSQPFLKINLTGRFVLFKKDVVRFLRTTSEWSQLVLISALVVVYVFSISRVVINTPYLKNITAYANAMLAGFIISALALRFCYTSLSIEGKFSWFIMSIPFKHFKIFFEKSILGMAIVSLSGIAVALTSSIYLNLKGSALLLTLSIMLIFSAFIPLIATFLGFINPVFSDSPHRIQMSPGGIFFLIFSSFYVLVHMSLFAHPMKVAILLDKMTLYPIFTSLLVNGITTGILAYILKMRWARFSIPY